MKSPYEQLLDATRIDFETHILRNPLLQALGKGEVSLGHYLCYLQETFHLVRHTSRALALAASRTGDELRDLRAWLLEQANEEHGHELFCLKDLRHLGVGGNAVESREPGPGAWSMVAQNYFLATNGHPAGILGVASATEQMGSELAGTLSGAVASRLGIDSGGLTFLRSHASFDVKHLAEVRKAVDQFGSDETVLRRIVLARRYTIRHYGQMFRDVLGSADEAACTEELRQAA